MANSLKLAVSFLFLMQSLLFQTTLHEMVLCFGGDGHVAVENADEYGFCEYNGIIPDSTFAMQFVQNHDKPVNDCFDILLDRHFGDIQAKNMNRHEPGPLNPVTFGFPDYIDSAHKQAELFNLPGNKSYQARDALKTIILLI